MEAEMREKSKPDVLINKALILYTDLHDILHGIDQKIRTNTTDALIDDVKRFNILCESGKNIDAEIAQSLTCHETGGYQKDIDVLKKEQGRLAERIKDLMGRAKLTKSLLANEAASINRGRTAMQGYKSGISGQGRIINNIS